MAVGGVEKGDRTDAPMKMGGEGDLPKSPCKKDIDRYIYIYIMENRPIRGFHRVSL